MKLNKVLRHPEKEEIIRRLRDEGESVKSVERWLKQKHPKSKRLQISYMTLQKFRKEYLDVHGQVLEDIKKAKQDRDQETRKMENQMVVNNSTSYMEKINEIADGELNVTRKLLELEKLISSRMEYYYNVLSQGGSLKEDKVFLEYIDRYKSILQDWKKYVEGMADQRIEHNVSIKVINDQVGVVKGVIFEVLEEMNQPELIPIFIEKVNRKMARLEYDSNEYKHYQDIIDVEPEQIS